MCSFIVISIIIILFVYYYCCLVYVTVVHVLYLFLCGTGMNLALQAGRHSTCVVSVTWVIVVDRRNVMYSKVWCECDMSDCGG